jgi:hypothetical protein
MSKFHPGDFVACYLTNTQITEGLLQWGIVLKVSDTLQDVYVLDSMGNSQWYPAHRWTELRLEGIEKTIDIDAILA